MPEAARQENALTQRRDRAAQERRLARYATTLEQVKADAFVLTSESAVQHASGVRLYTQRLIPQRPIACVIAPPQPPTIVCVEYEEEQLTKESPELSIVTFREFEDPWTRVAESLDRAGARRVIVEDTIPATWLAALESSHCGDVTPSDEFVVRPRIVKEQEEVAVIEEASLAAECAIATGAAGLEPGVSEHEISEVIRTAFLSRFSARATEVTGICIGPQNIAQMHHVGGFDVMPSHGPVRLGLVGRVDGYWVLLTRMLVLGDDPHYDELHARYVRTYKETAATLRAGAPTRAIYEECEERLADAGLRLASSKIGHGTGLDFRELPWLSRVDHGELMPGVVLAFDYATAPVGPYTFHIEDRMLVETNGPRWLSRLWDIADPHAGWRPASDGS